MKPSFSLLLFAFGHSFITSGTRAKKLLANFEVNKCLEKRVKSTATKADV